MLTSMPSVPLQTLPTFCAVARARKLRTAADALHLTHSAVSQQIRLLESRLGVPLFDRAGRRLALNAAGRALLDAVEPALLSIEQAARAARLHAPGHDADRDRLRISLLPSFAQRWLLPRMARWRERHPTLTLELHASLQLVDLAREGFHAALRQGTGPWPGLHGEPLVLSALVVVGAPAAAARVAAGGPAAIAGEALLGAPASWTRWFALAGLGPAPRPVAQFTDAGMMLQAVEQGLGIALVRELLAADALQDGRLQRLSPLALPDASAQPLWLVWPPAQDANPALAALRDWLRHELALSQRALDAARGGGSAGLPLSAPGAAAGTRPAGRTGSRTRARSAPPAADRG